MPSVPDVEVLLAETFDPSEFRIVASDEFVLNDLIVMLIERPRSDGNSYFWIVLFEHYSNGWFEILSDEGLGMVYTHPAGTTVAIVSSRAPRTAKTGRVRLFGEERTRPIVDGVLLAGFFSPLEQDPAIRDVSFSYF